MPLLGGRPRSHEALFFLSAPETPAKADSRSDDSTALSSSVSPDASASGARPPDRGQRCGGKKIEPRRSGSPASFAFVSLLVVELNGLAG